MMNPAGDASNYILNKQDAKTAAKTSQLSNDGSANDGFAHVRHVGCPTSPAVTDVL